MSRGVLTLLAIGLLIFHVCALDTKGHWSPDRVLSATSGTSHTVQLSDVHSASCDGIKPGMSGATPTTITSRVPPDPVGAIAARPILDTTPVLVSRPPLFLLHGSLLI
jgi:hypothetical protein